MLEAERKAGRTEGRTEAQIAALTTIVHDGFEKLSKLHQHLASEVHSNTEKLKKIEVRVEHVEHTSAHGNVRTEEAHRKISESQAEIATFQNVVMTHVDTSAKTINTALAEISSRQEEARKRNTKRDDDVGELLQKVRALEIHAQTSARGMVVREKTLKSMSVLVAVLTAIIQVVSQFYHH